MKEDTKRRIAECGRRCEAALQHAARLRLRGCEAGADDWEAHARLWSTEAFQLAEAQA